LSGDSLGPGGTEGPAQHDGLTRDLALTKAQVEEARKLNRHVLYVSARTGGHVQEAFTTLAMLILEARKAIA